MKKIRRLWTKSRCTNIVFKRKHSHFEGRIWSGEEIPQEEKFQVCGWRPSSYIEGTTHVKCLACLATIEIIPSEQLCYD